MTRHGWVVGLLAAACSRSVPPSEAPISEPGASLVVVLAPSPEVPTGVRLEVSNPSAGPIAFCRFQTPFEGVLDDIFEVRTADGAELPFHGPILEGAHCQSQDWFAVQPGRFHVAEIDLADGYPLQAGQVYAVRYRGSSVSALPPSDWIDLEVD